MIISNIHTNSNIVSFKRYLYYYKTQEYIPIYMNINITLYFICNNLKYIYSFREVSFDTHIKYKETLVIDYKHIFTYLDTYIRLRSIVSNIFTNTLNRLAYKLFYEKEIL